jgi:hypothetical protein
VAAGAFPLVAGFRMAPRLEYRRRSRQPEGEQYVLIDARVARRFGPLFELFVEGTNLLDEDYHEIAGVIMPGAAMTVSIRVGR